MFRRWEIGGEDYEILLYQKLLEHGFSACPPLGQACPFDLVAVSRFTGATHKIQMKTVTKPYKNDVYRIRFTHGGKSKQENCVSNVDVFVAYLVPMKTWMVVPNRISLPKSLSLCANTSLKSHPGYEKWELLHRHHLVKMETAY